MIQEFLRVLWSNPCNLRLLETLQMTALSLWLSGRFCTRRAEKDS